MEQSINNSNGNNVVNALGQRELRCPYCLEYFEDPNQHFIAKHQVRIKDINSILDIER